MKAIVLAGETRSKISTITRVIPKQLLPITSVAINYRDILIKN